MKPADAPRISIVVPAYNEADYLPATLQSLRAQEFDHAYEVIVVDNASTDATADLARDAGARVVTESMPSVCAARQAGVDAARGEVIVSTDADTRHPHDWLSRLDASLRTDPSAVAVAGPCTYLDPPAWARRMSAAGFGLVDAVQARTGRVVYLTATNLAVRREHFPGYLRWLTQGGDEFDLLRRLRREGRVIWDRDIVVETSARRLDQGLLHTLFVSYGWYYLAAVTLNRWSARTVVGRAPAIR